MIINSLDSFPFVLLQWFPRNRKWQLLYLVYRWILALYFLCWFVVILMNAFSYIKWKYLIYISNWSFLIWLAYLVFSAISLTLKSLWQLGMVNDRVSKPSYYCYCQTRKITYRPCSDCDCKDCVGQDSSCQMPRSCSIMDKIQWPLFTVGTEFAVAITLLYWTLFYEPHSKQNFFSIDSLHIHLINGVLAFVDLWVSGVPVRIYHALHSVLFAVSYVVFTGVYYAAGGTDPTGNSSIYPFLNYKSNPGSAVGLGIACALVLMTSIHLLFYLQFLIRNWITCYIQKRFYGQNKVIQCRRGSLEHSLHLELPL